MMEEVSEAKKPLEEAWEASNIASHGGLVDG